jgi:phosphoribosylformimino-5-aminoimidazole carboxamide ribotide isomerase
MKIRPCIDLHNGKVKQIVGGTLKDENNSARENFVSPNDAAYFSRLYKRDRLTGGHIIKLGPGNESEAEKALRTYPLGLQIGGGINSENCLSYLEMGASHVIVTSYVFSNGEINFDRLKELVRLVGKERLVLDLSCRKVDSDYFVVTDRWQKFTNFKITENNLKRLESYCNEFLIHAADVEGLCRGIETDLVQMLGKWVSIPATYAGGARSLEDADLVAELGRGNIDLTIGSALDIFGGDLPYRDVVKWNIENSGV